MRLHRLQQLLQVMACQLLASYAGLNPINYFRHSAVDRRSNCIRHRGSLASRQAAKTEAWAAVPVDEIMKACEALRPKVESMIAAEGSWS